MPSDATMVKPSPLSKLSRVAIVHDLLLEYGGSERVLEQLLRIFPHADLYTLYYNRHNRILHTTFHHRLTGTSFLQHLPFIHRLNHVFSIFKLYSWIYFARLDLSRYHLIITSSHSYNSKIARGNPSSLTVSYLHTPPKYLYPLQNELMFLRQFPWSLIFYPFRVALRLIDQYASRQPDLILTNSQTVQARIQKYYQKDATIVPPPVSLPARIPKRDPRYYVAHSRLVKQKGLDLIITTCNRYKLPLKIIGQGYWESYLKKLAGSTVEFLGWIPDKEVSKIYQHAIALLYAAVDEDYGIVPVEALTHGVPVIAYNSGGVQETIIDGKTGVLYHHLTPRDIKTAINQLSRHPIKPETCLTFAQQFTPDIFRRKVIKAIKDYEKQHS